MTSLQVDSLLTDYQIPIMNATAGAIIGTVITRGSIPVSTYAYLLDYYFFYDYYSYYVLYYREVLGDEYGRYILYRTATLRTEPSYWNGITNASSVCYDNSVPVISTPLTVHISSVIYTPGPMLLNLYVMSYNPYYYYSEVYRIQITTPACAPTERFDPVSQKCVSICGCGLVNHELPFCLYFGKPLFFTSWKTLCILSLQIPTNYQHLCIVISTTPCLITTQPFLNYLPASIITDIISCYRELR